MIEKSSVWNNLNKSKMQQNSVHISEKNMYYFVNAVF